MRLRSGWRPALIGLAVVCALVPARLAAQETCSADSFGEAVDASAAELRAFSAETQPKLRQKLQDLRDNKGWTDPDFETKGLSLVHDKKLDTFDAQASELLSKIDTLGSPEATDAAAAMSCSNLTELKAASSELMAIMRAKSSYLIARIDAEIAKAPAAPREVAKVEPTPAPTPAPAADPAPATVSPSPSEQPSLSPIRRTETPKADPALTPAPPARSPPDAPPPVASDQPSLSPIRRTEKPKTDPAPVPVAPSETDTTVDVPPSETDPVPAPPKETTETSPEGESTSSWSTTTAQAVVPPPALRRDPPPPSGQPPGYDAPPPGVPYEYPPEGAPPPPGEIPPDAAEAFDPEGGGYSIDEIREATRGFFGTISTSLASVIEYSFKQSGQPTAYVLGTEGGGAFLAGLRYGEGTLYLRNGGSQKVYWHGPSIGYDLGAAGSRTLFLIYDLQEPGGIFRRFTGVDGSAYLVGGVGMTLLKGGPVIMAPIRSGLGLRIGASIGYLRFTPRPTWNPF